MKKVVAGVLGAIGVMAVGSTAANALPAPFTWNPSAPGLGLTGLAGQQFTADTITATDYDVVQLTKVPKAGSGAACGVVSTSCYTFIDKGVVVFSSFQLNGHNVDPSGLGSNYSFYVTFEGTGSQIGNKPSFGNPIQTDFSTLDYTLWGNPNPTPTVTLNYKNWPNPYTITGNGGAFALGEGSVIAVTSSILLAATKNGSLFSVVNAENTLLACLGAGNPAGCTKDAAGFFVHPSATDKLILSVATNGTAQAFTFTNYNGHGYFTKYGNGTQLTLRAIPEPSSIVLFGVGLGGAALVIRRKKARA